MATGIFTDATALNGDRFGFAEAGLDHLAEFCAPPLAPTETPAAADILLRQGTSIFIQPPDKSDVREIETSLGSRRKLIVVTAVGAVLFVGALACFFLSSAGEKPPTQSAE
jgi:hypothetical protein